MFRGSLPAAMQNNNRWTTKETRYCNDATRCKQFVHNCHHWFVNKRVESCLWSTFRSHGILGRVKSIKDRFETSKMDRTLVNFKTLKATGRFLEELKIGKKGKWKWFQNFSPKRKKNFRLLLIDRNSVWIGNQNFIRFWLMQDQPSL